MSDEIDLQHIRRQLKYKRDTLHLAHETLKKESDFYQKIIIFTSLASGIFTDNFILICSWYI